MRAPTHLCVNQLRSPHWRFARSSEGSEWFLDYPFLPNWKFTQKALDASSGSQRNCTRNRFFPKIEWNSIGIVVRINQKPITTVIGRTTHDIVTDQRPVVVLSVSCFSNFCRELRAEIKVRYAMSSSLSSSPSNLGPADQYTVETKRVCMFTCCTRNQ